jgi:hypothetical protein
MLLLQYSLLPSVSASRVGPNSRVADLGAPGSSPAAAPAASAAAASIPAVVLLLRSPWGAISRAAAALAPSALTVSWRREGVLCNEGLAASAAAENQLAVASVVGSYKPAASRTAATHNLNRTAAAASSSAQQQFKQHHTAAADRLAVWVQRVVALGGSSDDCMRLMDSSSSARVSSSTIEPSARAFLLCVTAPLEFESQSTAVRGCQS